MLKKFKKIGCFALAIGILLTACARKEDSLEEEINDVATIDLNGYAIVRGYDEESDITNVASKLYMTLKNEYKLDISFGVDEEVKESEKEIVIGATNRTADKNHRYSDYSIEYKDGKIYIAGGSGDAVSAAVKWFLDECVADSGVASTEKMPYEYNASYPFGNLKISGVALSEFVVDETQSGELDALKDWLGPNAGTRKTSEKGYTIKAVNDPTLYLDEANIELVGKELILSASTHIDNLSLVTNYFLGLLKSSQGEGELAFDQRTTLDIPNTNSALKDVRAVTAQKKAVSAKAVESYKVGDEIVFVASLYADSTLVSCPEFTWTAKTADGKDYSGKASGGYGKLVIKIPTTSAGNTIIKVLVRDENGALIDGVAQSENYDQDPIFSVIVKSTNNGLYMKQIPKSFETTPNVYAVNDSYQIIVPVTEETLMWVEVGGKCFYDDDNGILRSNCTTHKMTVPMELLDAAGEYKVYYRIVEERKPYNSVVSEIFEYSSVFKPVTSENPRFFSIADAHNKVYEPVEAAKAFGEIDFLILNGDIPNDAGDIKNFLTIHKIASEITNGEIPVVFARGNHDMRGIYAENLSEHTPTDNGKSYYTFRLGSIWGIVLDCGEDKYDTHPEYGHTVCCEDFRRRQVEFLNSVIENAENEYAAEGVTYRMVVVHDPFTEYQSSKVSEADYQYYTEWARLLRESVQPDIMITGHVHRAYITYPGDPLDRLPEEQPCPIVVGSAPKGMSTTEGIYVASGFELNGNALTVSFVGQNGVVYGSEIIEKE